MADSLIITEAHLKLLRRANVGWEDCEFGAPAIDCKRPYGNSSVYQDIAEILGWEFDEDEGPTQEQEQTADRLHTETLDVLQIALCTGQFKAGSYYKQDRYNNRSWMERTVSSPPQKQK